TSRCPSCGFYYDPTEPVHVAKGDKILALKFQYQFVEPKRWDVIVFKNPMNPAENYIKRLIGKPGEKVEIIDGDIYINDRIERKPPKVQNELWMVIYNSDYAPAHPYIRLYNGHNWEQPLKNFGDSGWKQVRNNLFTLSGMSGREHRLVYDSSAGNDFRATYAYDGVGHHGLMPVCTDLMVEFYAEFGDEHPGRSVGAGLRKFQRYYKAMVNDEGLMTISRGDRKEVLASKTIDLPKVGEPVCVKFSNVDHLLTFEFGDEQLSCDLGTAAGDAGPVLPEAEPEVEIIGSGELAVSHIAVYRDTYYLSQGRGEGHAIQGHPITLAQDEFFALGDNSPASSDGRWWDKPGIGNNGKFYRPGVVPREYLVAKAFVVFWPSGFRPFEKFPFRIVPNVEQIRLIYGGSDKNQ
ncbi:MAG: signal peptidase I, partial [Phycisphaerae bacterium]